MKKEIDALGEDDDDDDGDDDDDDDDDDGDDDDDDDDEADAPLVVVAFPGKPQEFAVYIYMCIHCSN